MGERWRRARAIWRGRTASHTPHLRVNGCHLKSQGADALAANSLPQTVEGAAAQGLHALHCRSSGRMGAHTLQCAGLRVRVWGAGGSTSSHGAIPLAKARATPRPTTLFIYTGWAPCVPWQSQHASACVHVLSEPGGQRPAARTRACACVHVCMCACARRPHQGGALPPKEECARTFASPRRSIHPPPVKAPPPRMSAAGDRGGRKQAHTCGALWEL